MMMDNRSAQSGYYQEIARAFLKRRGGGLVLSPKDQAAIAAWEEKRVPLDAVLEGIERAFDWLKARGRATRTVPLSFCDRSVEAAFAQHRERAAGRRKIVEAAPLAAKSDKACREIVQALDALDPADIELKRLLEEAGKEIDSAKPDEAALERIDAEIEALLWSGATEAEKAAAAAETKKAVRGRTAQAGLDDAIRRRTVMAVRARRRIPHVSLHFY
jgi:hypothetical protein